jgi:hypothetical protein
MAKTRSYATETGSMLLSKIALRYDGKTEVTQRVLKQCPSAHLASNCYET